MNYAKLDEVKLRRLLAQRDAELDEAKRYSAELEGRIAAQQAEEARQERQRKWRQHSRDVYEWASNGGQSLPPSPFKESP